MTWFVDKLGAAPRAAPQNTGARTQRPAATDAKQKNAAPPSAHEPEKIKKKGWF